MRWLAPIVGEMGVDLFPEFAATRVLVEDGRVVGVRTGDKGIDKNGQAKPNFEPGVDIKAKITILAEGPRGTLTKQLADDVRSVRGQKPAGLFGRHQGAVAAAGRPLRSRARVIHTLGWPLDSDTFGGGFIYGMNDRIVDIGLVVGLDYKNPTLDPHQRVPALQAASVDPGDAGRREDDRGRREGDPRGRLLLDAAHATAKAS